MNGVAHEIQVTKARLLLCAAACLSLGACMTAPAIEPYGEAPVDPNSPAAAAIAAETAQATTWPRFGDIPQLPTDVRTPAEWRLAVNSTEQARAELVRATAPSTFSLSGTEAFAERVRAMVGFDPADVPTAADAAATEAWAAAMRARATPPPRPR